MSELVAFVLAQIAADEAAARAATPGPWRVGAEGSEGSRVMPDWGDKRERTRYIANVNGRVQPEDGRNADHIARHDPARVLAEVDAKRRIVEVAKSIDDDWPSADEDNQGLEILRLLAQPYADRPGWDEAWKVET